MTWQIELSEEAENFLDKLYKADKKGVSQIHKKLLMISKSPKNLFKINLDELKYLQNIGVIEC